MLALIGLGMMVPKVMEILERPFARFQRFGGSKNPSNGFLLGLVLGEHDDADPADEVLRQVEQAQHGRSEEREDRETDHKAGYHEVGVEAGGESRRRPLVIAAITACALCSCRRGG